MKTHRIQIIDWLGTGIISGLRPGDPVESLVRRLGEPDAVGPAKRGSRPIPGYWLYGAVEFGVSDAGMISWIQADTCRIGPPLFPEQAIELEWMGLFHNMRLSACRRWLDKHGFAHEYLPDEDGGVIEVKRVTRLLFTDPDDPVLVTALCALTYL